MSFGIGLLFGVILAGGFALLIGLPILRLRGHYFAIATLALGQVMTAIVSNVEIAGQNIGLVLPILRNNVFFYELSLMVLAAVTLNVAWLTRSRFGLGLTAIRENEEAAAVMGINTTLNVVFCTESAQRGGRSWSSPQVHVWTVKDGRATVFWQYRAISRPKTSSGRRRSNQKVGRSLRPEHFRPWGITVDVCGSWQCSLRAFARCRTVPQRRHQVALDSGSDKRALACIRSMNWPTRRYFCSSACSASLIFP
jgi:hypothetical protein